GLLHRVQQAVLGQPLDRRDPLASDLGRRGGARRHRAPADQHSAGAARALAAAQLGAGDAEILPDPLEQAAAAVGHYLPLHTIDSDRERHAGLLPPPGGPDSSSTRPAIATLVCPKSFAYPGMPGSATFGTPRTRS